MNDMTEERRKYLHEVLDAYNTTSSWYYKCRDIVDNATDQETLNFLVIMVSTGIGVPIRLLPKKGDKQ